MKYGTMEAVSLVCIFAKNSSLVHMWFLTNMANFVANILQVPYWRKTHTPASYATKTSVAETSQKFRLLDVVYERGKFVVKIS